ncbi:MAG: S8 family serine peptidase, partial [Chloroflexota bacterium]|nr:S8 family serine peptidase [Chloroflexota bacterium]
MIKIVRSFRVLLPLLVLALAFPPLSSGAQPVPGSSGVATLLIGYDPYMTSTELNQLASSLGATVVGVLPEIRVAKLRVVPGLRRVSPEQVRGIPKVEFAEPETLFRASELPSPLAAVSLSPNDPKRSSQWYLSKIAAPYAWPLASGSSRFPIAIVDTGIDKAHPDLAGRIAGGYNFLPGSSTSNYQDDNGHGTHVAGIAAAATNNGVGVSGLTLNTPIYAVKVLDYFGYGEE